MKTIKSYEVTGDFTLRLGVIIYADTEEEALEDAKKEVFVCISKSYEPGETDQATIRVSANFGVQNITVAPICDIKWLTSKEYISPARKIGQNFVW